jgi:tetratricopeptide (TPR) repeat protein
MKRRTHAAAALQPDRPTGAGVLALAKSPQGEIATRKLLPRTRLGSGRGLVDAGIRSDEDPAGASLVTRRYRALRRRRRNQVLVAVALVLALFPPVWALYLIGWLVWRSRPRQKSMRQVRSAVRALEKDQSGAALKQLQDAHLLDPTNADALYWMGLLLSRHDRPEEAEEALSLVSERVPGLPEVEAALVDAYVAMDEPESAVYHAQRLFDAAPYATESLHKLADAFEALGRWDLAIQALEQAPIHRRTLTDTLLEIHYRLGMLHERQGDAGRALHHFKRVYARDITFRDIRSRVEALEQSDETSRS